VQPERNTVDKNTFDSYMRRFHFLCPDDYRFVGLFAKVYASDCSMPDAHDIKIAVHVQYTRKGTNFPSVCPKVLVDSIAEALPLLQAELECGNVEWPE